MSSTSTAAKRKWDEAADGPEDNNKDRADKAAKEKSAQDAAAAAAAIAAKIAAQFANGQLGAEGAFEQDLDINDVRNRYMLTKSTTQQDIQDATGATVVTKGIWYPDRSRATDKDPPLYLHVSARNKDSLQKAIDKVNELISIDLGSLVEDKKAATKRKWPEEKLPVGLESIRNFNVRAKVVGPSGSFVKYIQQETGTRVQIKGIGSGFMEPETGKESEDPLYIHITGPEEIQVARAKVLTEDLLLVVRSEHAKMQHLVMQQQMELHNAQTQQYASYNAYDPTGQAQAAAPPAPSDTEAYAAYWAAYGYDVNSDQFKEWVASQQQQQYSQYYGAAAAPGAGAQGQPQGYNPNAPSAAMGGIGSLNGGGGAPMQPTGAAPPPPPPPSDAPPPPPV